MRPFEIVIDGTDRAGKTPLVEQLLVDLKQNRYNIATCAPYRVQEVYYLWKEEPEKAASIITNIMDEFRENNLDKDIILWDRGWPTAYVTTDFKIAKDLFLPLPNLTVLLINSVQTIIEKVEQCGLTQEWLANPKVRDEFNEAYRNIHIKYKNLFNDKIMIRVYYADKNNRFDLKKVSEEIIKTAQKIIC